MSIHRLDEFFIAGLNAPRCQLSTYAVIAECPSEEALVVIGPDAYQVGNYLTAIEAHREPGYRVSIGLPQATMRIGGLYTWGFVPSAATAARLTLQDRTSIIWPTFLGRIVHIDYGDPVRLLWKCRPGEEVLLKLKYG